MVLHENGVKFLCIFDKKYLMERLLMMVRGAAVMGAAHGLTDAYICSCIAQWASILTKYIIHPVHPTHKKD